MDYLQFQELYHHGIKGQKWGIRRFQNEDGSLTPEGEKRYGTLENFEKSKDYQKIVSKDKKNTQKILTKKTSETYKEYNRLNKKHRTETEEDADAYEKDVNKLLDKYDLNNEKELASFEKELTKLDKYYDSKTESRTKELIETMTNISLKELKINNTEANRKYINKLMEG